jgi:hypothetical protein
MSTRTAVGTAAVADKGQEAKKTQAFLPRAPPPDGGNPPPGRDRDEPLTPDGPHNTAYQALGMVPGK